MKKHILFLLSIVSLIVIVTGCTKVFKSDVDLSMTGSESILSGETFSGELLTGDILSGDMLSGELLTGTELSGDIQTGTDFVACTMDYTPMCAKVQIQCITTPCEPIEQTFSNRCMMEANKLAEFAYTGECKTVAQTEITEYCLDDTLHMKKFEGENANIGFNYHVRKYLSGYLGYYFGGQDGVSFQLTYCDNVAKKVSESKEVFWFDMGGDPTKEIKSYMFYRYRDEKKNTSMDDPSLQIKAIKDCTNILGDVANVYQSGSCMQKSIVWIEKLISGDEKNSYFKEKNAIFLKSIK